MEAQQMLQLTVLVMGAASECAERLITAGVTQDQPCVTALLKVVERSADKINDAYSPVIKV